MTRSHEARRDALLCRAAINLALLFLMCCLAVVAAVNIVSSVALSPLFE